MFDVTVNYAGSSVSSIPCVTQKNSSQNTHSPNGNVSALYPGGRALINPFDPSHVTVKVTSNRRRWTHIFPKGSYFFNVMDTVGEGCMTVTEKGGVWDSQKSKTNLDSVF